MSNPELQFEAIQQAIMDAAVDAIIIINDKGLISYFSSSAERLFGYDRVEVLGQNVKVLMPAKDAHAHDGYLENYTRSGRAKVIGIGRDVLGRRKDGSIFPMHLSVGEAQTAEGRLFVGICHDLSEFKGLLEQLSSAERRYKDIIQYQREFICRLSSSLRLSFVNNAFCEQLGYQESEVLGISLMEFIHEDDRQKVESILNRLRAEQDEASLSLSCAVLDQQGSTHFIDWTFRTLPASSEFHYEIQAIGNNITEQVKAKQHAKFLAEYDSLTGFFNKDGLNRAFARTLGNAEHYAVFFTDCYRFRLINEKYGQDVGDLMLIEAAQRIKSCMPADSLICRPGADDFLLVVPLEDKAQALQLAETLLQSIIEPYVLAGEKLVLSAVVGISFYGDGATDLPVLVRQAESAMFEAKASHHPVRVYHQDIHQQLTMRLEIEQGIRRALDLNLFEVVLQAKYNLADMSLDGYEALIRWHDPELGTVSPQVFVAIAEKVNLGIELDLWVLSNVLQQISTWRNAGFKVKPIAVNITAAHFSLPGLFSQVERMTAELNLPMNCIELEITEGVAMGNSQVIMDNLQLFKRHGVNIAIDDFGTGYSSLGYLKDLPVQLLKIDRVFIKDIEHPKNYGLVNAMIAMADAVGMRVLAEGIETERQRDILLKMGCDLGQGYLFAKPVSYAEIEATLLSA
ncbi:putative bifunctional diguanylate cyclase/phosphodiesterase [Bowmanella yangjiangensis]|uniref:EAL domain-containing protein n=1 Tax=Bowmanella yangjiangensis TaxID=2811230 RepID=A0ABS3CN57_9ALTE|nr:EAL domain-containing protein [Bowmanella yangjiangensis]MBN7818548.1 EAL domain-containing protein [Bowmanella yangjiangensis]